MNPQIAGIVLAAGRGTRFRAAGGDNKLLARAPSGRPVVVEALRALRGHCDTLLAAVPARDDMLKYLLDMQGARTYLVTDPDRGMGHSLACVAAQVPPGWAAIVMLGDMPFVQSATVARIAHALREGAPLAVPTYQGRRGHPVGFAPEYLAELQTLDGDRGAQALLQRDAARMQLIAVDDPGVHVDIDLPEGLRVGAG